jgi:hypothetical protein
VSAPGLVIVLELERAPRLVVDCANEPEKVRLDFWLQSDEKRRELLETLFELLEERAA